MDQYDNQKMPEIQKFKQGIINFFIIFLKVNSMRTILSLRSKINNQPNNFSSTLLFKPVYYARSSKRNPQNPQQPSQHPQTPNKSQHPNPPNQNPQQPKKEVHLTGPKRLLQLLNSGNHHIIPFYLKVLTKNTRNPSLPIPQDTKNQAKINSQTYQQKTKPTKSEQTQQTEENQKKWSYPFNSPLYYRQRLAKKYKIVQSLRSTCKQSTQVQMFAFLKDFDLRRIFRDPVKRTSIIRFSSVFLFLTTIFLIFWKSIFHIIPKTDQYELKSDQMTDSQIQAKLNDIKEIKVKKNVNNQNQIKIVLNEEKNLGIFQTIFSLFGFEVQRNKSLAFNMQNPNLVLDGLEKLQQNKDHQSWIKLKPQMTNYKYSDAIFDTLFLATPFIGLGITYWIFRKVNPDSMLKGMTSNKKSMKIQSTKDIKVRFKDVAGMENAKKQITQFVDFLKNSDKYVQMGAKIPKGALLTGPPGTGKTMLAKACAGQAGTSFFYVSGSEFVQMFVGLGASRVRELFAKARQQAPSIIFIDEIDAIGKKRQTSRNEQKDSTLNQMLVEMDGFSTNQTVIVLAATNRKDILDSALTRPGRFDRMVEITLPEIKARQEIFMVHLSPLKVNPNKLLSDIAKRLAQLTPGFSGADIANLCNEAAIIATRKKRTYIEDADFEEASERIMAGYVKKGLSNQKTKKRVAYHEAGHAVCGWYLKGGDPLVKLTIIPRSKGALGYAQYLPKTAHIRTKSQLIDQIAIMLGGTTSEQIFLNSMSSGNSDDLQKVYGVARRMITQFGMGSQTYNMTLDEQTYVKKQSEKLCNLMDEEMLQLINQATLRARQIIEEKRDIVQQLTKELLQKETINNEDILRIMGERPAFN